MNIKNTWPKFHLNACFPHVSVAVTLSSVTMTTKSMWLFIFVRAFTSEHLHAHFLHDEEHVLRFVKAVRMVTVLVKNASDHIPLFRTLALVLFCTLGPSVFFLHFYFSQMCRHLFPMTTNVIMANQIYVFYTFHATF